MHARKQVRRKSRFFLGIILLFLPLILQARFLRVKNIKFNTSEEALRSHFSKLIEKRKILRVFDPATIELEAIKAHNGFLHGLWNPI